MESVDPGGPLSDAEVRESARFASHDLDGTVWRQDDNGNRYEVSRHDTRAEADSTAAMMEVRGHKQTYWVARSA